MPTNIMPSYATDTGTTPYNRNPYEMPAQQNTGQQAFMKGAQGMLQGALMGAPGGLPGMLAMAGIQLIGGLISGITQRKPSLTPEQQYFQDMTQYYYSLGKRQRAVNTYKRAMIPNKTFRDDDWGSIVAKHAFPGEGD